jgi:hypothetical protein
MGFRLANVAGRAALVDGDHYFDLAELSGVPGNADPMVAITMSQRLTELSATLGRTTDDRVIPDGSPWRRLPIAHRR